MDQHQFLLIFIAIGITSSEEQPKPEQSTLPSLVREVENNSRYKTFEANVTMLKLLVSEKSGVSEEEVFDMLHSPDSNPSRMALPVFPEDMEVASLDARQPDTEAEFLQAPEQVVRKDSRASLRRGEPGGAAAGIMVVVTCSIVLLGYTGLVVWRKIYLKRNGLKHELLRNEENVAETRLDM